MESTKRLFKKGEVAETPSGEKMLVNEAGTAYSATDVMITIWDSFEGNTVEEVATDLATTINRNPDELMESVNVVAAELEKADLLHS